MVHLSTLFSFLTFFTLVSAQARPWETRPFNPPAFPLAVRSPYLSAWLPGGANGPSLVSWPKFWNMNEILGWAGYVRVDGEAYRWMGEHGLNTIAANQTSVEFTATQTTFVLQAGPVDLTVTFLSPIEPSNFVSQSLPFSYLSVSVASRDGSPHRVQLYSDISAEWVSGDAGNTATWSTTVGNIVYHQVQLQLPQPFQEIRDHIEDGTAYYGTSMTSGLTWETGIDADVRTQFVTTGTLRGTQDTAFRPIRQSWPVFAFAQDLGSITSTNAPVVFAIGLTRDPAIRYVTTNNIEQERHLYFWSEFSTGPQALEFFLNDYARASGAASAFDQRVQSDASAISREYAGLVALSARQAFGAIEITLSKDPGGNWDRNDVKIFMKEISSNGNVNTVDAIFSTSPMFLYTNPEILRYLLEPLFQYQQTGGFTKDYAIHDIGKSYPRASGYNREDDYPMPVEECGNMLILSLAYSRASGDATVIYNHYNLLQKWADYLINHALTPEDQLSTDDFAGTLANQTNLAIKGIIGIKAFAEISRALNKSSDATRYDTAASSYITQWEGLALSTDGQHYTLNYGNDTSWGLLYNLFADRWIGTNIVPAPVIEKQTAWYSSPGVMDPFGVRLDTRNTYTKADWMFFAAGLVTNDTTRDLLISQVHRYASNTTQTLAQAVPFSDWYDAVSGNSTGFRARPVVGASFALLVRDQPSRTIILPPPSPTNPTGSGNNSNGVSSLKMINPVDSLLAIFVPYIIASAFLLAL